MNAISFRSFLRYEGETYVSCIAFISIYVHNIAVPSTEIGNCTTGAIRLGNGTNDYEGRVEICINNAWGTICNNRFSTSDTRVICRDLGYTFSDSYTLATSEFSPGTGPIFLDELECRGDEERVLECQHFFGIHSCTHDQDAAMRCVGKKRITHTF